MNATIRIRYPLERGRIVLRTEADWQRNIEPERVDARRHCHEFAWKSHRPFGYFKPVLLDDHEHWAAGDNFLWLGGASSHRDYFPHFLPDSHCSECELRELTDASGRRHRFRVFYPPGYHENQLRRYPVLYMQDGQNLFFPGEAFGGRHWRIAETLRRLDSMNAIEQVIVVGIYPLERERDYTQPGYEAFGRFLTSTIKPCIDSEYRTLRDPSNTLVMGSSLGGVVSLYLAWQYPEVFGGAACLSSTFGWRDDLAARIAQEARRPIRIYLDSGWPNDNFEATRHMHSLLALRGYRSGQDLHYFSFPDGRHDEDHWALRAHLPFQLFFSPERTPCKSI